MRRKYFFVKYDQTYSALIAFWSFPKIQSSVFNTQLYNMQNFYFSYFLLLHYFSITWTDFPHDSNVFCADCFLKFSKNTVFQKSVLLVTNFFFFGVPHRFHFLFLHYFSITWTDFSHDLNVFCADSFLKFSKNTIFCF